MPRAGPPPTYGDDRAGRRLPAYVINQLDVLLRGEATTTTYIKSVLNFCVPFVVSNLGLLAGRRDVEVAAEQILDR